jgi:hypothetical protein
MIMDMYDDKKNEFISQLLKTPSTESRFKVGDSVIYTNEYGVEFESVIVGFSDIDGRDRHIHLDNDCYWFPVSDGDLRFVNESAKECDLTKDLTLKNGQKALFLSIDYWSRPTYKLESGRVVCCTELNGTHLHTITDGGEPCSPLKEEFQPV